MGARRTPRAESAEIGVVDAARPETARARFSLGGVGRDALVVFAAPIPRAVPIFELFIPRLDAGRHSLRSLEISLRPIPELRQRAGGPPQIDARARHLFF